MAKVFTVQVVQAALVGAALAGALGWYVGREDGKREGIQWTSRQAPPDVQVEQGPLEKWVASGDAARGPFELCGSSADPDCHERNAVRLRTRLAADFYVVTEEEEETLSLPLWQGRVLDPAKFPSERARHEAILAGIERRIAGEQP